MTHASEASSLTQIPALAARSLARLAVAAFALAAAPLALAAPFAYVANSGDGTVSVIDVSTGTAATPITVGTNPLGVLMNPAGTRVYVSNFNSDTVSVIDTSTNTVTATVNVGKEPELMALSPDGATLYVVNLMDNTLSFVDTTANTQTTTVKLNGYSTGVAVSPDGSKVYVSQANIAKVAVISVASKSITTQVDVGLNPLGIALNTDGSKLYVANYGSDSLSVIDTATNAVTATVDVGVSPIALAFNAQKSMLYITNNASGTVSVFDPSDNTQKAQIQVGPLPVGIQVDSNGAYAYVTSSYVDALYVVNLSTNAVNGAYATGTTPEYLALTSANGLSVNLDQRGLTGTWYDVTTSGQGLVIETFPDTGGAGQGTLTAGWFTYDTTAAGGQRWYSLQGPMNATDPSASLTIYAATGGNFNAGPAVGATQVGTATLRFVDCVHGILTYSFSDGRTGFIPITRLTANITCGSTGSNGAPALNSLLSGAWYDPATSGQGLEFEVNPTLGLLAAAWYTYAPNGQQTGGGASQRWYSLQALGFTPGSSTASNVAIIETTGGVFHDPTAVTRTTVGSATVTFASCSALTVAYTFTAGTNQGLSGTLNLVRVGPTPQGCTL